MTTPISSHQQILALLNQLNEGDKIRVLKFATGILQDRQGKKAKRRSRFQQPEINDWRIDG
jgi:hypothetical protein